MNESLIFNQVAAICKNGTFTLPGTSTEGVSGTWSPAINNQQTTVYTFTPAANQCALSTTITITVNQPSSFSEAPVSACTSYSWHGTSYNTSGTKTWTGTNAVGCDSVVTINISIKQPTSSSSSQTACSSLNWNGTTYSIGGTYTHANWTCGYDTLHLTIDTCSTTDVVVYPSPTTGKVKVNWSNANFQVGSKVIVSVYDRAGKLVSKTSPIVISGNGQEVDLGLSAYSNGLYLIKIETTIGQSARYSTKIIKSSN